MNNHFTWDKFFKIICGSAAIVFLFAIVLKLVKSNIIDINLSYLLISFGLVIILPYLSKLDALGVKLEIKQKVDDLSSKVLALPDYILGSEYHECEDLALAERAYRSSLEKCSDFWPAILGLACVFEDRGEYDKSIMEYKRVLVLDPENAYAYNNLAELYLYAPDPIKDPKKSLEMADKALNLVPSLASSMYYKGEALNNLGMYSIAYKLLKGMLEQNMLPKGDHDIQYELAIASSNLGMGVNHKDLNKLFISACDNGEGKSIINLLANKDEQIRFSSNDIKIIEQFVEDNRNYLENNTD